MTWDGRTLASEFLEVDQETKRQLVELAQFLLRYREPLACSWHETYQDAASKDARLAEGQAEVITGGLLDLFFDFVPRGDFECYYRGILDKGKECQASDMPYGLLLLAVHHIEQVALPFLAEIYHSQKDLEHALVALDRLCDNSIVLIASSYFETATAELRALQQVTDTALSTLEVDQLLRSLLLRMIEAIRADAGAMLLFEESTGAIEARCYVGLPNTEAEAGAGEMRTRDDAPSEIESEIVTLSAAWPTKEIPVDPQLRAPGHVAAVSVPLRLGARTIGVVQAVRWHGAAFGHREVQLLTVLAERAAAAVEHAELYERTAHLLRQTAALQRVTTSITARMALPQLLQVVIDGVAEVFGANRVAIYLQDHRTGSVTCPAMRGLDHGLIEELKEHFGVVRGARTEALDPLAEAIHFYSPDVRRDFAMGALGETLNREGIRTILVLPFGQVPEAGGALCLLHDNVRRYEDEERRLAQTFADQTAIAIAHATLYVETRERAAELDRLNSELQTLDRMKADFLAMISHELRTPLTAILGYTDLLLRGARGELGERPAADLKTIRANGHRLLGLINDLIDFSSVEAGRAAVTPRLLQLSRLLPQILETFEKQAESASIALTGDVPVDLPSVLGDTTAVEKVLSQLLSNAIKFTSPGGTIVVRAREESRVPCRTTGAVWSRALESQGNEPVEHWVVVSVSDTGVGIPEGQLSRIWDHFYQVDSSSARRYGGTGLGLAIVKRLVEVQGGTVWAESRGVPGEGATFSFSLPVTVGQAAH